MRIRNLILCLFAAMCVVAAATERASAQCWNCKPERCMWGSGSGCVMDFPVTNGYDSCYDFPVNGRCSCFTGPDGGDCVPPPDGDPSLAAAKMEAELSETVVAIKAGQSIPAKGSFVYVSKGPDLVVRRRCDMAEVARVAIAEVEPVRTLAGG